VTSIVREEPSVLTSTAHVPPGTNQWHGIPSVPRPEVSVIGQDRSPRKKMFR